jgi:hypothetical protein
VADPGVSLTNDDKMVVTGWGKITNDETQFQKTYSEFGAPSRCLDIKHFYSLIFPLAKWAKSQAYNE